MIGTTFLGRLAMISRRKAIASAMVYGLTLSVRLTSATGEETEPPVQSMPLGHPILALMTGGGTQPPYRGFIPNAAQPVAVRQGWPLSWARTSPAAVCAPQ